MNRAEEENIEGKRIIKKKKKKGQGNGNIEYNPCRWRGTIHNSHGVRDVPVALIIAGDGQELRTSMQCRIKVDVRMVHCAAAGKKL